jgi:phosphatidylserine/phosphatidylglycerophosphate/cardiolipin synthase-like enzyme
VEPVATTSEPGAVRLLVGGLAVAVAIRDAIDAAQSRVLITAPYVHSRAAAVRAICCAARAARTRGADVRILLGAHPASRDAAYLLATGVPARWMDPAASTRGHAKGVVADATAIVTSANWSHLGLGVNWESALAFSSAAAAKYLAAAWERDWAAAVPVSVTV